MKKRTATYLLTALTIISSAGSAAWAQDAAGDLSSEDTSTLRSGLQTRYDAALAATTSDGYIAANDPRYIWASEAKVQCAIALGYLKSNTRDATSIRKCGLAYDRMMQRPAPVVPVPMPTPTPPPEVCSNRQPGLIFFDFDVDVPKEDAVQTIQFVAANAEACGWRGFNVVGHTDRAGSDQYNNDLSARRARSVANLMDSLGIDGSRIRVSSEGESKPRVPTDDGVRNPQNRRVEITVSE